MMKTKMNARIVMLLAALAMGTVAFAQAEKMVVEKKDGGKIECDVENVKRVYFEQSAESGKPHAVKFPIKTLLYNDEGDVAMKIYYGLTDLISQVVDQRECTYVFNEDMSVCRNMEEEGTYLYNLTYNRDGNVGKIEVTVDLDFGDGTEYKKGTGLFDFSYNEKGLLSAIDFSYKGTRFGDEEDGHYERAEDANLKLLFSYSGETLYKIRYVESENAYKDNVLQSGSSANATWEFSGTQKENKLGMFDVVIWCNVLDDLGERKEFPMFGFGLLEALAYTGFMGKWTGKLSSECEFSSVVNFYEKGYGQSTYESEYTLGLDYYFNQDNTISKVVRKRDGNERTYQYKYGK